MLTLNGISLLLFTVAICYLFFGIDVTKDELFKKTNLIFFLICLGAFWWAFSFTFLFAALDQETAWRWLRLSYPGWVLLPGPTLHFCLILTGKDRSLGNWLYPLVYLPGFFFLFLAHTGNITEITYSTQYGYSGGTYRGNPFGYWSFSLYYMSYVILGNVLIYRSTHQTSRKGEKKKMGIISISMFISIILIYLVGTLFPSLGVKIIPRVPPLMALPWIAGMWFSITRYRILELSPTIATHEILSSIQNLLLMVNPQGEILLANQQSQPFFHDKQEKILQCSLENFLQDKEVDEVFSVLKGKRAHLERETILKGEKKELPVQMTVSSIKDKEGDSLGAILVFQDLTTTHRLREEAERRKRAEEELLTINQELKNKDQQKTDFLSLISHELRTPLTSVLGFAQIISKKFENTILPQFKDPKKNTRRALNQFKSNIKIIISESERLTSLINDVLDITKMEEGSIDWKIEIVNIERVIKQAIAATSTLFEAKNLPLIQDLEDDLPEIKGDRDRLIQVVINLLSNAVKFTQEGMVICRARTTKNHITVQIIDTGKGIPKGELEKIFQKYRQVKGTIKEGYQGTGLGLPISQEIIEYHGGQIWAESIPGSGSNFSFTLPVKKEITRDSISLRTTVDDLLKQLQAKDDHQEKDKKGILVVDDDKNIRQLLKEELEGAGYIVWEAANGQQALKTAGEMKPHLIIMDVQMPQLNGFETLELLKKDLFTYPIPVIILTVIEDKKRALQLGAQSFMEKPLNLPLLLKNIQHIFEKYQPLEVLLLHENNKTLKKIKGALEAKGFLVKDQESTGKENLKIIIGEEKTVKRIDSQILPQKKKGMLTILLEEEKKGNNHE